MNKQQLVKNAEMARHCLLSDGFFLFFAFFFHLHKSLSETDNTYQGARSQLLLLTVSCRWHDPELAGITSLPTFTERWMSGSHAWAPCTVSHASIKLCSSGEQVENPCDVTSHFPVSSPPAAVPPNALQRPPPSPPPPPRLRA